MSLLSPPAWYIDLVKDFLLLASLLLQLISHSALARSFNLEIQGKTIQLESQESQNDSALQTSLKKSAQNLNLDDPYQNNGLIKLFYKNESVYINDQIVLKLGTKNPGNQVPVDVQRDQAALLDRLQYELDQYNAKTNIYKVGILRQFSFDSSLLLLKQRLLDDSISKEQRIKDFFALIHELKAKPYVKEIEPDFSYKNTFLPEAPGSNLRFSQNQDNRQVIIPASEENSAQLIPNDELFEQQWYLHNTAQFDGASADADIDAPEAWLYTRGAGIKVAVLDEGYDIFHRDLRDNVIATRDFVNGNPSAQLQSIDEKHGTNVAGLIAASQDNEFGLSGVAPEAKLILARVSDANRFVSTAEMAEAIAFAKNEGADIINNSYAAALPDFPIALAYREAVQDAQINGRNGKGTILVYAAGNAGHDISNNPYTQLPGVVVVAAIDDRNTRPSYSNFGEKISIAAPSSIAGRPPMITTELGNQFSIGFRGTSASAPVASGVLALILSANPELSALEAIEILKDTAEKASARSDEYNQQGFSQNFGFGRVNAEAAVIAATSKVLQSFLDSDQINPKINSVSDLQISDAIYGNKNSQLSLEPNDFDKPNEIKQSEINLGQASLNRKSQKLKIKINDIFSVLNRDAELNQRLTSVQNKRDKVRKLPRKSFKIHIFDSEGNRLKSILKRVRSKSLTDEVIFSINYKLPKKTKPGVGLIAVVNKSNKPIYVSELLFLD